MEQNCHDFWRLPIVFKIIFSVSARLYSVFHVVFSYRLFSFLSLTFRKDRPKYKNDKPNNRVHYLVLINNSNTRKIDP